MLVTVTPQIFNPDTLIAVAAGGPVALDIAQPTEPGGATLSVTIDSVPGYGTVQYLSGANWTNVSAGDTLTPSQLASLRYVPPAGGEHSGGTLSYSVFNGTTSVTGTMNVSVVLDNNGPDNLYFSAIGPGNMGPDLFVLDSNGTVTAAPIRSDSSATYGSYAGADGGFVPFAGNLYFNGFTATTGPVLLALGPTGLITPVGDGNGGYYGDPAENAHFTAFNGSLYFEAISATGGDQLVKLNADGTSQTIVLNPNGQESFPGQNGGFTQFDGSLYFSAITQTTNGFSPDLIKLDANGTVTEISTRAPTETQFGSSAGEDGGFIVYNNALYFNAIDAAGADTLFELAAGSTTPVAVDAGGTVLSHEFGVASAFHVFNGDLYFDELSTALGSDTLFRLDAAGQLTALTFGGQTLQGAGTFGGFTDFAGSTFFVAKTTNDNTQLFKLDSGGTISKIAPNPSGDSFDGNISGGFVQFAGSLYFDAYDSSGGGDGLFKLDSNDTLTEVFTTPGFTNAANLTVDNGSLYFSAWTDSGSELVKLDASGSSQIFDINTDPGQSSAPGMVSGFAVFPAPVVPCYCAGTLILTGRGEVPVEDLTTADAVVTGAGALRPIRWIGRRSYGGRFVTGREDILPVCIKAGALDADVPKRDLWISPHHAMYLEGVLIEARDLVNGVSIVQAERVEKVEYFHIELDTHDVIIAEGSRSESFIDDESRGMFHNAHEYWALHPDEAAGPAHYCAPRPRDGYEVEAVRRAIALRAGLVSRETPPRIGPLQGYVERVSPRCIAGWAQNTDHPEAPVCLDIYAGDRLLGQTLANQHREDLERPGLDSGRHGFAFMPPAGIAFAVEAVKVRRSLDGATLALATAGRQAQRRITTVLTFGQVSNANVSASATVDVTFADAPRSLGPYAGASHGAASVLLAFGAEPDGEAASPKRPSPANASLRFGDEPRGKARPRANADHKISRRRKRLSA
jgi:hypothetical protein